VPPTLAERLGFGASDRVAVIHVDDIGMSHAANEGAFEALAHGPATCGSVMVPCPWFAEAAEQARAHPELDLGVHLVLNSEFPRYRWGPLAGRAGVPSLLDEEGFLPRTTLETVKRAKAEEAESELRAQVERALAAGIDVTHLDSHMGTCFFPPFLGIYAKLAREFELPVFVVRPDREALARAGIPGAIEVFRTLVDTLGDDGIPILDGFDADSLGFSPGDGEAHNRRRLAGLGPGVSYLICHAAKDGEELRAITPDSAHQRDFERRFYGGEAGWRGLEEAGVKTVGMRAIRDLLRSERSHGGER
jgi:predicted glycoside hydrolase/deacetylase ChbG (UPF0249 family)